VVRRKWIMVSCVIAVAVAGTVLLLSKGPKAKIRRACKDLASRVSAVSEGEGEQKRALKAFGLRKYFAAECELALRNFEHNGTYTPKEIAGSVMRMRSRFERVEVKLYDLSVTLESAQRARVHLTARVEVKRSGGQAVRSEARELLCSVQKEEGEWKFTRFEEVAVLRK